RERDEGDERQHERSTTEEDPAERESLPLLHPRRSVDLTVRDEAEDDAEQRTDEEQPEDRAHERRDRETVRTLCAGRGHAGEVAILWCAARAAELRTLRQLDAA